MFSPPTKLMGVSIAGKDDVAVSVISVSASLDSGRADLFGLIEVDMMTSSTGSSDRISCFTLLLVIEAALGIEEV